MPTVVTVGLSRKLSKDFQSTGYSLTIQSELPASAIQDPESMARATEELYQLAEDLIEEQVHRSEMKPHGAGQQPPSRPAGGLAVTRRPVARTTTQPYRYGGQTTKPAGNGQSNGQANVRGITDAQARALEKMAKGVDTTADRLAQDEFGVALQDLTVRQASQLIDQLKQSLNTAEPQGVRR